METFSALKLDFPRRRVLISRSISAGTPTAYSPVSSDRAARPIKETHQGSESARSGATAVYVQRLTSGGEEFRRLMQPTARGFTITLCAVQVCAGFGNRCVPCGPLPQCGRALGDRQMVTGIV